MPTQYSLTLTTDVRGGYRPEWAYRLYAALLKEAPAAYGEEVHVDGATPVRQFLLSGEEELIWTVNLLDESSERVLGPILEGKKEYDFPQEDAALRVIECRRKSVTDAAGLLKRGAAHSGTHRLHFRTATAFKSQKQYINLPTSRLMMQSLLRQWNKSFPEETIQEQAETLAAGIRIQRFWLKDEMYHIKGNAIPGFVGEMTAVNHLRGERCGQANALLLFAAYSGVGIKTTLGMGGVQLD